MAFSLVYKYIAPPRLISIEMDYIPKPEKPATGLFLFITQNHEDFDNIFPTLKPEDVTQLMTKIYKILPIAEKEFYESQAAEKRDQYLIQRKICRAQEKKK
jgi:hypothetical protein